MQYWLLKSEPDEFSIDLLKTRATEEWTGVRNYQARNFMRNDMQVGDLMFFYHSNCKPPGIAGIAEIVSESYPDHTAFDPSSQYPDASSTPDNPRWFMVDVRFKEKFPTLIPLEQLKHYPELVNMPLLRRGNRLSITPVSQEEWDFIVDNLAG